MQRKNSIGGIQCNAEPPVQSLGWGQVFVELPEVQQVLEEN